MPDSDRDGWIALLDELDREVGAAVGADRPEWRPPVGLGALPPELLERAMALAAAQADAISAVETAKRATGKQLSALRAMPQRREDVRPVYLDAAG